MSIHYGHYKLPNPADPDERFDYEVIFNDWMKHCGNLTEVQLWVGFDHWRRQGNAFAPQPGELLAAHRDAQAQAHEEARAQETGEKIEKYRGWQEGRVSPDTIEQCMAEVRNSEWFKRGKAWRRRRPQAQPQTPAYL